MSGAARGVDLEITLRAGGPGAEPPRPGRPWGLIAVFAVAELILLLIACGVIK
jgi:hypothetical protein